MMVILTGPLCLLCSYLAFLCFRRDFKKHGLVLSGFALLLLALTVAILGGGYYMWLGMEAEAAIQ